MSRNVYRYLSRVLYEESTLFSLINVFKETLSSTQSLRKLEYLSDLDLFLGVNVLLQFKHLYLLAPDLDLPQYQVSFRLQKGQVYFFFLTHNY